MHFISFLNVFIPLLYFTVSIRSFKEHEPKRISLMDGIREEVDRNRKPQLCYIVPTPIFLFVVSFVFARIQVQMESAPSKHTNAL